jgi:hypothetical protein
MREPWFTGWRPGWGDSAALNYRDLAYRSRPEGWSFANDEAKLIWFCCKCGGECITNVEVVAPTLLRLVLAEVDENYSVYCEDCTPKEKVYTMWERFVRWMRVKRWEWRWRT